MSDEAYLVTVTPPEENPVSLKDAKAHLRISTTRDDGILRLYLAAAARVVEGRYGIRFARQTVDCVRSFFPRYLGGVTEPYFGESSHFYGGRETGRPRGTISLLTGPVHSIESFSYYDSDDALQTLDEDDYYAETSYLPGWLQPKGTWPVTRSRIGGIRIRFEAGYEVDRTTDPGNPVNDVPEAAQLAIMLLAGHYYEAREEVSDVKLMAVPEGVHAIMTSIPELHHYSPGVLRAG